LDRGDRILPALTFVLVFAVYASFFGGTGWNQNSTFALTRALVEAGTVRIDDFRWETDDVARFGEHWYSNKAPGTALLAAIPYAPIHAVERRLGIDPDDRLVLTRNMYLCTVAVCGLSGAWIAAALVLCGARGGRDGAASVGVALVVAFATPLFAYATLLFGHEPNAALLFGAFLAARAGVAEPRRPALAGFLVGCSALCNYQCVPVVAFLLLLVWRGERRWSSALRFGLGALPPLALLGLYQVAAFGTLWTNPITRNEIFVARSAWFGIVRPPQLDALWGITFSPYRGLFFMSPVLLLAAVGAWKLWRDRDERRSAWFLLLLFALFVGFAVTFNGWTGGSAIGPRYLVPILPFAGWLLLRARGLPRLLWWCTAVPSATLNLLAVAVDPQPFERLMSPWVEHILPTFWTGQRDTTRFPWLSPGHVSVNRYSFNLGEVVFGSGSALSLLPILAVAIGGALALVYLARRSAAPAAG